MPNITQKTVNELDKSCWVCGWHRPGGITITGYCGWFESKGQEKKEVPVAKVDRGCGQWSNRVKVEYNK